MSNLILLLLFRFGTSPGQEEKREGFQSATETCVLYRHGIRSERGFAVIHREQHR